AVRQRLQGETRLEDLQRRDLWRAEHLGRVGLVVEALQVGGGNVVDVQRQHLEGERRVRQRAPPREGLRVDAGIVRRQVQAAVGRQALQQDVAERALGAVAAGADVLQASSSLRMRTMGASTVASACIFAMASFMRPSTVSWVRMMTSVLVAPAASGSAGRCSSASIEMPPSARMPVMRASTPA